MSASVSDGNSNLSTSDIIGIVFGGVIILVTVLCCIFTYFVNRCKNQNRPRVGPQQNQYNPYYPPNGGYGQQMTTGYYPQNPPYQPSWNNQSNNSEQLPSYSSLGQTSTQNGKY